MQGGDQVAALGNEDAVGAQDVVLWIGEGQVRFDVPQIATVRLGTFSREDEVVLGRYLTFSE
jgi:hypothetical protein